MFQFPLDDFVLRYFLLFSLFFLLDHDDDDDDDDVFSFSFFSSHLHLLNSIHFKTNILLKKFSILFTRDDN
jgi:hypothetical protein